ncbi:gametogenetin isoform X2 [Rhinoderma darwinii]|uniref:gametogenetin isoform X2 n=1 Tax=Rhinoderma darwinii TaxID=43563 RepID=UPI003F66C86A
MGNIQTEERLESYKTTFGNLVTGGFDEIDKGTQPDVSSPAPDFFLVTQPVEQRVFRESVADDIEVNPIETTPWKVLTNLNQDISALPLLKQEPLMVQWSVPKISSPPINCLCLDEGQVQKPLTSENPAAEGADESIEDNTEGTYRVAVDLIRKEAAAISPLVFGFSSGSYTNKSLLYPTGMVYEAVSVGTQLSELPTISCDRSHVTDQVRQENPKTTEANPTEYQTLKSTDTSAISQDGSLAKSNSTTMEALPNVTQPPKNNIIPLDGSQNTEQAVKAYTLFDTTSTALESPIGDSSTKLHIHTPGIQEREAEKITQETADTRCMTETNPIEDGSMSIPKPSSCNVQPKTQEETQVRSVMCFSYADALKKSLTVPQQRGATKPLGKNVKGVIIQQKFERFQNTTNTEKNTNAKAISFSNVRQNRAQGKNENPSKKLTKYWNTTGPSTQPFKMTKAQPRFQWISPSSNPKDHFQFKGSQNMAKPQTQTPNNSIEFCKRDQGKDKVQQAVISGSTWTVPKNAPIALAGKQQEQTNLHKIVDAKKDRLYQSYPIERRNKPKLVRNVAPTVTLKEPVKNKVVVSAQPQDMGLPTPESSPPKKPSSENKTLDADTLEPHVLTKQIDQISNCETPQKPPDVKPDITQLATQPEITEDTETSPEEHGDTSDLSNSCPVVSHIKEKDTAECTDSNDSDQSLVVPEIKTASEPPAVLAVPEKSLSMEKEDPDVGLKHQPSGRWKDFYVDNICTTKCMCKHRPGKLPRNVVSCFPHRTFRPKNCTTIHCGLHGRNAV